MIYKITAKENKTIKQIKALKKKNGRAKFNKFIAEGKRISEEALNYAADKIWCMVVSESFFEAESEFVLGLDNFCDRIYCVPDNIFCDISDTETPQGIMTVLDLSENTFEATEEDENIVVLDGVSEPGNMGTVIRTAEALGFDGIYLTKGCADIHSPKVVRATMGSVFRMKFRTDCLVEDIAKLKGKGFSLVATTPNGDTALEKFEVKGKMIAIIGNEAHGISREVLKIADHRVKITMEGRAESFNAAVASGIVLHWLKVFGKK